VNDYEATEVAIYSKNLLAVISLFLLLIYLYNFV